MNRTAAPRRLKPTRASGRRRDTLCGHAHSPRRRRLGDSHRDRCQRRLRLGDARPRPRSLPSDISEGIAAAAEIGATYHCLDEPDVHVVFDQPTIRKVIDLLRRIAPTCLFTHPRHDYMLDHEQVHLLARAAAFSYSIPNASTLPLVDGSAIPWLYYCDPVEGTDPYTGVLVTPTTTIDISAADRTKSRNARLPCFAARLAASPPRHGRIHRYHETPQRQRGQQIGVEYAEAFTQHRGHPFPQSDLLTTLLR